MKDFTKTCQCNIFFSSVKIEDFSSFFFIFFLFFLFLPCRGGSNEYLQSMFWSKNVKNRFTPAYPSFAI